MKKIDILIPNFEDFGAQRVAINVANGLAAEYQVSFVVFADNGPFKAYLDPKIKITLLDYGWSNIPKIRIVARFFRYWRFARRNQTDVAIAFSPVANLVILFAKLLRWPMKTIIQEHGFPSLAIKDRQNMGPILELVFRFVIFKLYNISDIFLCITEAIKDDFVKNFATRERIIRVVRNPVDISKVERLLAEPVTDFEFKPDYQYLLGIGRHVEQKNFAKMIRVLSAVRRELPDTELIILGEGPGRPELEALVDELGLKGAVHLPGFTQNPYNYIAKADVFCLTSRWEGLPQVIAEAMVCKTPVVANDCPSGPSEMIVDGETGRLVALDDEAAFVAAVIGLLKDETLRQRLADQAHAFANREYSIAQCVSTYKRIIEEDLT
jgi:glycosyltransferase involved in cell wall biosynthesis